MRKIKRKRLSHFMEILLTSKNLRKIKAKAKLDKSSLISPPFFSNKSMSTQCYATISLKTSSSILFGNKVRPLYLILHLAKRYNRHLVKGTLIKVVIVKPAKLITMEW